MSNRHHHQQQYKPSSHSRTTNPLTARTVIYDETSPNPSLKSSVRQVVETTTTSFYNTNPTSNPSLLTIGSGKRSRPINSEMYHSEIVDDVEDDDDEEEGEEEEGEMDYLPTHHRQQQIGQKIEKKNRRTHRRSSSDDRSKRRRHSSSGDDDRRHHHHHRSPPSVEVIENDDAEQSSKHKRKKQQQRRRRDSFKEEQSPSEEGEEGESISGVSDDRHSKDEHQSGTTNEEEKDQKPERIHSSSDDHSRHEQEDGEDVEPPPPAPDAYHRSRFDDHDDDEEEENDRDRHRHRTHKRSRRRSSSTSSTSTSTGTPPLPPPPTTEPEPEIEVTNAHLDATPIPQPTLPIYYPAIQGCRRVDEYQCLNRIEEGTYGVVFRARETKTGEIVALKRLKMEKEKEGFPITSLREICCILKSQHENVVTVREIVVGNDMNRIYIVMDYVEHDLKSLMTYTMKKPFSTGEIKTLMLQLLSGINHLHDNWIIHRDLKTSNLLLSNKGILKIGDFGLAREYGSPLKPYTPVVVTLWYRAPELLLGIKEYATSIDIWSVGAIFGELLLMKPLFPGKSELDQLNRIFKDLGTPNEKIWPEYNTLPFTKKMNFTHYPYNRLRTRFDVTLSEQGFDLINKFLTYDPTKRISAQEALKHGFFSESPRPIDPSMFPTWPSRNEEKDKLARGGALGAGGSSATAAQNEPKPPSGGKMYEKLLGAEDDNYPMEQSLPPPIGFQLRG